MIFSAGNLAQAFDYLRGMFGMKDLPLLSAETVYNLKNYGFVLIIAAIGATPAVKFIRNRFYARIKNTLLPDVAEIIIFAVLLLIVTGYLADGSFNPFLYFRF